RLNGKIIHVSRRNHLNESIIAIGFAKSAESLKATLPYFNWLVARVRKIRMMGAAALALTYVATGRFDGYVERGIRLWDIAAGSLIVECAGGEFWYSQLNPAAANFLRTGYFRRHGRSHQLAAGEGMSAWRDGISLNQSSTRLP